MDSINPPTDAGSASTLDGANWLSQLLSQGIAGYVAVQTVKSQVRDKDTVTTAAIPRVDAPAADTGISTKAVLIGVGILLTAGLLVMFMRRR